MRHATLRAGLSVLTLLTASACSDGATDSVAAVSSGDPATCPGEILDVVVSTSAWSDVVRRLGGACATVTTIAPAADAPADIAAAGRTAITEADLVVVNGARYDDWAVDAAAEAAGGVVVVSAAEVAAVQAQERDPHLWHDPAVVPEVAAAVARELARLSPDAAPYFDAQHATWTAEAQPALDLVAALRAGVGGKTFAATEDVFGRMAEAVGLTDATPPGYLGSARTGNTPSPEDVAAIEAALRTGAVDVLIQDGEVDSDVHDELRETAEDVHVPVVEVTAAPEGDAPFLDWQLEQLESLAAALAQE